jgi:hypothetical protein
VAVVVGLFLIWHLIVFAVCHAVRLNANCDIDVFEPGTKAIPADFVANEADLTRAIGQLESKGFKRVVDARFTGMIYNADLFLIYFEHSLDYAPGVIALPRVCTISEGVKCFTPQPMYVEFVTRFSNPESRPICTSNNTLPLPLAWANPSQCYFLPHINDASRLYELHRAVLTKHRFSTSQKAYSVYDRYRNNFAEYLRVEIIEKVVEGSARRGVYRVVSPRVYGHTLLGSFLSMLSLAPPNNYVAMWVKRMRGIALERKLSNWVNKTSAG